MKKKQQKFNYIEFSKDVLIAYKKGILKILNFFTIDGSFSLFLINLSLWLLAILLFDEFIKYPDLNYIRIIMLILLVLSAKLSMIIYYIKKWKIN